MIVIKIELWKFGNEKWAKEIARAYISNDCKTTAKTKGVYGSYTAKFQGQTPRKKNGKAINVHRKKRGVWDILYLCLKSIGMEKRNE